MSMARSVEIDEVMAEVEFAISEMEGELKKAVPEVSIDGRVVMSGSDAKQVIEGMHGLMVMSRDLVKAIMKG